ncbi:TauD-domain-containing protein [Suillus lakei]|nr:TauD-domain-containing protein [Suillus lakei]
MSVVETVTEVSQPLSTLNLRGGHKEQKTEPYSYAHLLPHFSPEQYPPLTPFKHEDPGFRALKHTDPRAFLKNATNVVELTPNLGTEVHGVNLATLDSDGRDQLALEVARRGLMVFRGQHEFIDRGPDSYLEWGRHFGRLHIHPTSGHPKDYPQVHLVYKDAKSSYNFEREDSITSTVWHSDVSYELQPPGLTTFFLLSQPTTGGDTLFTSQISTLKKLSPSFVAFLRTLSAVHSGVEQAQFSRSGKRGGIHVHPLVRRHPVTGEEALYVNRQFTTRIVGLKREESETILKFLYDHSRVKWQPWHPCWLVGLTSITIHQSAIVDYGKSNERRHGARITPQAERPVPALEGLELPRV